MIMAKKVQSGDEYKLMKQTSTPKKIAKLLICLWVLLCVAPAFWLLTKQNIRIKEYAVVFGLSVATDALENQYQTISNQLMDNIDINQYTAKIDIPEVKLDKITETLEKTQKATGALSKLGIGQLQSADNMVLQIKQQVDKVNADIQKSVEKISKTLTSDIEATLKKQLTSFASSQTQKQLGLTNAAYQALSSGNYGVFGDKQKNTAQIYQQLSESDNDMIKNLLSSLDKYFSYLIWILTGLLIVIALLPIVIVWWIASKLSATFTQCPYCDKVFISKKGAASFLKFWK